MKESMHVTVPADALAEIRRMAKSEHRSLSSMVSLILVKAVEDKNKKAVRV